MGYTTVYFGALISNGALSVALLVSGLADFLLVSPFLFSLIFAKCSFVSVLKYWVSRGSFFLFDRRSCANTVSQVAGAVRHTG